MWPALWLRPRGARGRLESSHLVPAFPGTRGKLEFGIWKGWGRAGKAGQQRTAGAPSHQVSMGWSVHSAAVGEVPARALQRDGALRGYVYHYKHTCVYIMYVKTYRCREWGRAGRGVDLALLQVWLPGEDCGLLPVHRAAQQTGLETWHRYTLRSHLWLRASPAQ